MLIGTIKYTGRVQPKMCRWKGRNIQLIIWHSKSPVKHSSPLALAANAEQDMWMMCLDNTCRTSCCSSSTDDNVFLTPRPAAFLFRREPLQGAAPSGHQVAFLVAPQAEPSELTLTVGETQASWHPCWENSILYQRVSCQVEALSYCRFNNCIDSWTNTLADVRILNVICP